ncbi:MAG: acetyl-CoA C-acyltransferase, partial [Solirubrobacteraceae bacterium]
MPKTVILASARTPIGKLGGGLASLDATVLGGVAIKAALERAGVEPEDVQHVIMGQV